MFRLVCYDISNPKRLRKVAKICEAHGVRLQKSCFQADVEDNEKFRKLITSIEQVMNKKKDSLIIYAVCDDCSRLSISLGPASILDPDRVVFL